MQGGHSGSHAYSVGCYHYICIYGFPTTFKLRRGIAVPRLNRNAIRINFVYSYSVLILLVFDTVKFPQNYDTQK